MKAQLLQESKVDKDGYHGYDNNTQKLEAYYRNHWSKLIRGVRVEGDTVVIKVKGGNDEARRLCGELINEMEARDATQ